MNYYVLHAPFPPVRLIQHFLSKCDTVKMALLRKKLMLFFHRFVGSAIVFNIESLVDFILATGDFSDPETRLPFSDQDLTEIDALVII